MKKVIIASKNSGKVADFEKLLNPLGFKVESLLDYPEIPEVEETGTTFKENALLKAETISKALNLPVLADDSGLVIDALGGDPGVLSARFAGEPKNDSLNITKVLSLLESVKEGNRDAHFQCTLALAHPKKNSLVVKGEVYGKITRIPKGEHGFGYDSIFYVPELRKTFGELTIEEKNSISHRARAFEKLETQIESWFTSVGK